MPRMPKDATQRDRKKAERSRAHRRAAAMFSQGGKEFARDARRLSPDEEEGLLLMLADILAKVGVRKVERWDSFLENVSAAPAIDRLMPALAMAQAVGGAFQRALEFEGKWFDGKGIVFKSDEQKADSAPLLVNRLAAA